MLLAGTLEDHVAEIDQQAEDMLDRLMERMAKEMYESPYAVTKDRLPELY